MNASSPSARQPACPVLVPIGRGGTFGFCNAQRRHVYLEATDRCLCDFCSPGQDGDRVLSPDVFFAWNDIVMLKSERATRLAEDIRKAETIRCAPKAAEKPAPAAAPAKKREPKPAPAKKAGLLAFT